MKSHPSRIIRKGYQSLFLFEELFALLDKDFVYRCLMNRIDSTKFLALVTPYYLGSDVHLRLRSCTYTRLYVQVCTAFFIPDLGPPLVGYIG